MRQSPIGLLARIMEQCRPWKKITFIYKGNLQANVQTKFLKLRYSCKEDFQVLVEWYREEVLF